MNTAARMSTAYASIAIFSDNFALAGSLADRTRMTMCGITGIAVAQMMKFPRYIETGWCVTWPSAG